MNKTFPVDAPPSPLLTLAAAEAATTGALGLRAIYTMRAAREELGLRPGEFRELRRTGELAVFVLAGVQLTTGPAIANLIRDRLRASAGIQS